MPWDGTELRVADSARTAVAGRTARCSARRPSRCCSRSGSTTTRSTPSADGSGYWNLYRVEVDGRDAERGAPVDADLGGPLWGLGTGWYLLLADGRLLTVRTLGTDTLAVLDPETGSYDDIDLATTPASHSARSTATACCS